MTLAASALLTFEQQIAAFGLPTEAWGRTLCFTTPSAGPGGVPRASLLPDSVIRILGHEAGWYVTSAGHIDKQHLQPMYALPSEAAPVSVPAWLEVCAPSAVVRAYATGEAPSRAHIGHGGIARAVEYLPPAGTGEGWYGIADDTGALIGWSPAKRWRRLEIPDGERIVDLMVIDRAQQTMTALSAAQPVATFRTAVGTRVHSDSYVLASRHLCMPGMAKAGAPWAMTTLNGPTLVGAYWHNSFGSASDGDAVELPPLAARWLYGHVADQVGLIVA
jgi:hypothetical protein